ncbi:MAG: mycothiol conjugate amidase Mca [Nitriliruptoraceae bacterium]
MTRRLLFVHAHPDDESSKGAATAARLVDEGAQVVLVTCTGGEAGDLLNPHADPVEPGQIAAVRARELADAVAVIGFTRTHHLGHVDSGYHEDPADVPQGTFSRLDPDVPGAQFARILREERPHVVVTYPEDGGYPHPDHVMTHTITMRALAIAEDPAADVPGAPWRVAKVYAPMMHAVERLDALIDAMVAAGREGEYTARMRERREGREHLDPDARILVADHLDRRDAALRAHVTQVDPTGPWFEVPRDLERAHYPYEAYELLRSDVDVEVPEEDLFAGIDVDAWDAATLPVQARR